MYDITEYVEYPRRQQAPNPLELLLFLKFTHLGSSNEEQIASCMPIIQWSKLINKQTRYIRWIMAAFSFLYTLLFVYVCCSCHKKILLPLVTSCQGHETNNFKEVANVLTESNDTQNHQKFNTLLTIEWTMFELCALATEITFATFQLFWTLFRDGVSAYYWLRYSFKTPLLRSSPTGSYILATHVFRGLDSVHVTTTFISYALALFYPLCCGNLVAFAMSILTIQFGVSLSCLIYLPLSGFLMIVSTFVVKQLITDIFFVCITISIYMLLLWTFLGDTFASSNFANPSTTWYSSFLIMLNMIDMKGITEQLPSIRDIVLFTHFTYIFFLSISILNFMVAKMCGVMSLVESHKRFVWSMHYLEFSLNLEKRLRLILPNALLKLIFHKNLIANNGRLYILCPSIQKPAME